jgi:hypothetical protein
MERFATIENQKRSQKGTCLLAVEYPSCLEINPTSAVTRK